MSHIFDSKLHQSEFYIYEYYVVYLHVRSCSPYSHLQTITIWLPARWAQASLATTNRCNHVYVVLFFILLFMYAVIHCLYSVGNKITTTTTIVLWGVLLISSSECVVSRVFRTRGCRLYCIMIPTTLVQNYWCSVNDNSLLFPATT